MMTLFVDIACESNVRWRLCYAEKGVLVKGVTIHTVIHPWKIIIIQPILKKAHLSFLNCRFRNCIA